MSENFWDDGLYKRGFIVVPEGTDIPASVSARWKELDLPQGYKIAYDPLNKCRLCERGNIWLCLCGSYAMDVDGGHMDFGMIAHNLEIALCESEDKFFDYLEGLNGRFVCMYSINGKIYVLNDACGARSVFYSKKYPLFASHYNLVQEVVHEEKDPFWDKFCEWRKDASASNRAKPWVMPADRSPWQNILGLLPNHKICFDNFKSYRFYPRNTMKEVDIESACDTIADILRKEANILSDNYKVYESLTAGNDTRISMAAMRERKSETVFFTYHDKVLRNGEYESEDRLQNYNFAKNLCKKEGLEHREIFTSSKPLPKDLTEILNRNHYHRHIPSLLEPYSKMFTKRSIHLRSNLIESIRGNAHTLSNAVDERTIGIDFAKLNRYYEWHKYFPECADIFKQYYYDAEFNNVHGYPVYHLMHWEHNAGLWVCAGVLTESDIVCDTFMLFNCRKIMDLGLSLPLYYRNRSIIYENILKRLWPELLNYGLPNCSISQYDLLNKNYSNKDNFIYFSDKVIKSSANVNIEDREVKGMFEPYMQGIVIGFASNKLQSGDYVCIKNKQIVKKDMNYYWQCCLKTQYVESAKGGISYVILFNGKEVYRLSTMAMYSTNVVRLMYKAEADGENEIEVRLIAEKDFNDSLHNGALDISNIEAGRDYSDNQRAYKVTVADFFSANESNNKTIVERVLRKLKKILLKIINRLRGNKNGTKRN
ncbi:MAG: hypothetical protein LUI60_08020 [Clostridia bacterium]|nr:hypothetical protein [Clostridia bacterium]